ncbi:hypothetical protein ACWDSJ_09105 [Nocardia sp. NPDC003482]
MPTDYRFRFKRLVDQLGQLRLRGGASRAFVDLEDQGPLDLPDFFPIVKRLRSQMWADENRRIEAINWVLEDAISSLPTHSLSGAMRDTLSWQEAARILFNIRLTSEAKEAIQRYRGQLHARLARYVREQTGMYPKEEKYRKAEDKRFHSIVEEMREKMAEHLLKIVPNDGSDEQAEASSDDSADIAEPAGDPESATAPDYSKGNVTIHKAAQVFTGDNITTNPTFNNW